MTRTQSLVAIGLALAGFVTGLLVGMTGMGGGSLMTPILIFFFNFNPSTAIGTDILHGAIFKSFGAVRHRRLGTVRARLAAWMLVGSAPASLLGVWVAHIVEDHYGDGAESLFGDILGDLAPDDDSNDELFDLMDGEMLRALAGEHDRRLQADTTGSARDENGLAAPVHVAVLHQANALTAGCSISLAWPASLAARGLPAPLPARLACPVGPWASSCR